MAGIAIIKKSGFGIQQVVKNSATLFAKFFCFILLLLSAYTAQAKELQFEENWITLESGHAEMSSLHYDYLTDVLTVRSTRGEQQLTPEQVISFSFGGYEYYSLPFNGGFSFFKVLHEGSDFAVLQKPANHELLKYFVDESKGSLQICENSADPKQMILCEGSIGPSFGLPVYSGSSVSYTLQEAIFVAVDGRLNLVSYKYDTMGKISDNMHQLNKKNRRLLNRLKEVVGNQQKMMELRRYYAATRADLEDPNELIIALQTVYN
ncbi:hypothetical protein [Cesiribacter sp. SM1]|uniref:hypothetical protein n=1 Tax=Cesiribacter sp. SM1 TaxID=2861196 RepID=UPI001CD26929|nr:hypothetical protein [Cesiribacter sp. SM1]